VKQSPGTQRKKKAAGPDSNWDKAPMPENAGTSKPQIENKKKKKSRGARQ
jgi:hypothetical protein